MAYLANNHKDKTNSNNVPKRATRENPNNINLEQVKNRNGLNNNGFKNKNNSGNQYTQPDNQIANRLERVKEKQKKEVAKKAIVTGLNSVAPGAGTVADQALKTEKGEKYLDAYAKAETPQKGIQNVLKLYKEDRKKTQLILAIIGIILPVFLLCLLVVSIFKNADSQIFSNENDGTVESEDYKYDDPDVNIFAGYPNLYEKVVEKVNKVSDKYQLEIDKYLIIATLISPIENGLIKPVNDGSCGAEECYYFQGKSYTWEDFLSTWADQSELLAKMQILTYINPESPGNVQAKCGEEETMEQYAKNDLEQNVFPWWGWLNPVNWFKGFRDAAGAEVNAVCTEAPSYRQYKAPTVFTLSTEQGIYYKTNNANKEFEYVKEPDTGGVYFWNLINPNGFIHTYLKDYLSDEYVEDTEKNYEANKSTIVDTVNYIYLYYDSIRKDCEGHKVIESTLENINVYDPKTGTTSQVEFEDQYIGGVMLAEYNSGDMESLKAFAILARTEAAAVVGTDGSGTIENSSNDQNYNPNYSPEKYPKIAEAVKATRGLVLSQYKSPKVWKTEYDAFCPQKNVLENGFYYLPEQQKSLPINPEAYEKITGKEFIKSDSKYLDCPCFKNNNSRPHDEIIDRKSIRYTPSNTEPPTWPGGTPSQATKDVCWTNEGITRQNDNNETEYGWSYKPTGGHGRGASQYGLKYYEVFGYDQDALLRMFFHGASVRVLSSSLENGKCKDIPFYTGEKGGTGQSGTDANYNGDTIGGTALNTSLTEALSSNGYTVDDLNNCIGDRVNSKGMGTRGAVVEAGVGLLECTMKMTGGFTYPYDHRGGYVGGSYNPDIKGKLGVNSKWGEYADYATGCSGPKPCRLGLNCANFVRWSMCNGGMDLCSRGSTYATGMAGVNSSEDYFPGAVRVRLTPSFEVLSGSVDGASKDEVIEMIQPGDVLYSDHNGSGNHVMLIVGTDSSSITIAENGRKTRKIPKNQLKSNSMTYVVLLLDEYYNNSSNQNSLSW